MENDVNAVDTSTTDDTTATVPVSVTDSTAESQNTVQKTQEHMIPKSRLDEVISQKKEALREKEELAARISDLEERINAKREPEAAPEPIVAPQHLSQEEQVRWLIRRHAGEMIKEELGMSLKDASTLLSTTKTTSEDFVKQKWQNLCASQHLDPESQEVQELVAGLVKVNVPLDKAFERAAKFYGKANGNTSHEVANVEDSTVSPVMTGERRVPRTNQEAVEMAARGEAAAQLSSMEIIAQSIKKAAGK